MNDLFSDVTVLKCYCNQNVVLNRKKECYFGNIKKSKDIKKEEGQGLVPFKLDTGLHIACFAFIIPVCV